MTALLLLSGQFAIAGERASAARRQAAAQLAERAARNPAVARHLATSRARLNPRPRVIGDAVDIEFHMRSGELVLGSFDPDSTTFTTPAGLDPERLSAIYARDQRSGIIVRLSLPEEALIGEIDLFRSALTGTLATLRLTEQAQELRQYAYAQAVELPPDAQYPGNQLVVCFEDGTSLGAIHETLAHSGCSIVRELLLENTYWVITESYSEIDTTANALLSNPQVRYVHPNWIVRPCGIQPDDPTYPVYQAAGIDVEGYQIGDLSIENSWQWFDADYSGTLDTTEAPATGVTIAIIDTGVDYDQPDIICNGDGHNFDNDANDPNDPMDEDEDRHGTKMALIAAASTNNASYGAGVAWGADVLCVRIDTEALISFGFITQLTDAITYAATHGADVINLSVGYYDTDDWFGHSTALEEAIDLALFQGNGGAGCVLVAASGNEDCNPAAQNKRHLPSDDPDVICVGGLNAVGTSRATELDWGEGKGSNYGETLDFCAPGTDVYNGAIGGVGWRSTGTSPSAAIVSGITALARSAHSEKTAPEIRAAIASAMACDDRLGEGWDLYTGWGCINAIKAIDQKSPAVIGWDHSTAEIDTDIYAYFDDRLDMSTVDNNTVAVDGSSTGTHTCTFTFVVEPATGYGRLRINPDTDFAYGETVYVAVTASVKDYAGHSATPAGYQFLLPGEGEGGTPPSIYVTAPLQGEELADETYLIQWVDQDPDSNASVWLYYDTDDDRNNGGYFLAAPYETQSPLPIEENDPQNSYIWDTQQVPAGVYYVHARISDGENEHWDTSPGTVWVAHPVLGNQIQLEAFELADDGDDGDGDGIVESGESVDCVVTLTNVSGETAYAVTAELISPTADVTVTDGYTAYGDIAPGSESNGNGDFNFGTEPDFSGLIAFVLEIEYEDAAGAEYYTYRRFHVNVCEPGACEIVLAATGLTIVDDCSNCDQDGVFESGEQVEFFIELWNSGDAPCVNPRGTLGQIDAWGADVFADLDVSYPDIPPNSPRLSEDGFDTHAAPVTYAGQLNFDLEVCYGPDQEACQQLPITLEVVPVPYITVSPAGYDFGVVSPGTLVAQEFTLGNVGSGELNIDTITADDADTVITGAPTVIAPGAQASFLVEIDTTGASGFITRTVTIASDAHRNTTKTILITGTVADVPPAGYDLIWEIPLPPGPYTWNNVRGADTDNDGQTEILATVDGDTGDPGRLYIYEKTTDDDFELKWTSPPLGGVMDWRGLACSDFDNDGFVDIVVLANSLYVSGDPFPYRVHWFEATGDDSWVSRGVAISNSADMMIGIDAGDADNDGIGDIALAVCGWDVDHPQARIYEQSGGSFTHRWSSPDIVDGWGDPVEALLGITIADSDSDGKPEVIFATSDAKLYIFESTGNNAYNNTPFLPDGLSEYLNYGGVYEPIAIAVADTDLDSAREIILASPTHAVQVEATGNNAWQLVWHYQIDDASAVIAGNTDDDPELEVIVGDQDARVHVFDVAENTLVPSWAGDLEDDITGLALTNTNTSAWNEIIAATEAVHIQVLTYSAASADVQIVANQIAAEPEEPVEGDATTLTATIQNVGGSEAVEVVARFYEGNPDEGGLQIGADQVLGTLPAGETALASVEWIPIDAGANEICVRVECDQETETGNNLACITVSVNDDDTSGPEISDVTIVEHGGDGNGAVEADEQVRIMWSATDPAGISESSLSVDGITYPAEGEYEVVAGPFADGSYSFVISATDADNSPATAEYSDVLLVYPAAPVIVATLPVDGAVDVPRMPQIWATFNTGLDPATVTDATVFVEDAAGEPLAGTVSYDGSLHRAVFVPTEPLAFSEFCTATVRGGPDGIHDELGNELASDYTWSFTVVTDTGLPIAEITAPQPDDTVQGTVTVFGTAWDDAFEQYELYVGEGQEPTTWDLIVGPIEEPVVNGELGTWDTTGYPSGPHTLRLVVTDLPPASNTAEALVTVLVSGSGQGDTIYVNGTTGDDAWSGLCQTWDGGTCGPKATIQAGLDTAADGDTVIVADGVYTGVGNKDLDFAGKAITLRSAGDAPGACVIDCESDGRGFYFHSNETSASLVRGFTITGGVTERGGGIACLQASPAIVNCRIIGNVATDDGGGVHCMGFSSPAFVNCLFAGNTASGSGGAAYLIGSSQSFVNCVFVANEAVTGGGAVWCRDGSTPNVINCLVVGNASWYQGGGFGCLFNGNPIIINSILRGNTPTEIFILNDTATPTVTFSNVEDGAGYFWFGEGCIDSDPLFSDPDGPDNDPATWTDNDYRLLPASSCIDTGSNAAIPFDTFDLDADGDYDELLPFDLDKAPRLIGNPPMVDMGPYEAQQATVLGDMNCDGVVTFDDIAPFVKALAGQEEYEAAYPDCRWLNGDIDGDGWVTFDDIQPFVQVIGN